MSAENCDGTLSVPLRNVSNSIQCIRDRVRGKYEKLFIAVKTVSQEATKLSLAFSRPPLPSLQDGEKLSEFILKSVLTLSTVYYWLPKSQGVTLRRQVRDATVEVLDGVLQLVEVIISSPLQSLTQEQITSTGGVWSACDRFARLPKDNKEALLVVLSSQSGVIKDAIEEMKQVNTNAVFKVFLCFCPYYKENLIFELLGLMKAAAACLRKLTSAVKANGDAAEPQKVAQLDDLADISREISPSVDDLALCLYPPMNYTGVENHVRQPSELSWVQFLEGAVDHNVQKAKELIELDG
uniref:Cyclin D-type binding-protein 1 n=1 Tax=Poecilia latipinna TaxID=48699 RepID=A0A3B3VDN7_9TELE